MMPSVNGSKLSTNSSSAFPPNIIICSVYHQSSAALNDLQSTNLVHLFQLQQDCIETRQEWQEFVQLLFSQSFVFGFLCVSLGSNILEVLGPIHEFLFSLLVLCTKVGLKLKVTTIRVSTL